MEPEMQRASRIHPAATTRGRELIRHIVVHHHAYLRRTLPSLQSDLEGIGSDSQALEARRLFLDLSDELALHMEKEERILFPAVEQMERELENGTAPLPPGCGLEGPIAQMSFEHQNALAALGRLLQIVAGRPAAVGAPLGPRFTELADDLREHIRLEEEELFPLARRLAGIELG